MYRYKNKYKIKVLSSYILMKKMYSYSILYVDRAICNEKYNMLPIRL